jgi:HK97 family phage portal protein
MGIIKDLAYTWKWRGQPGIQNLQGEVQEASRNRWFYEKSYDNLEVVRRGTDMIVDAVAEIDVNIKNALPFDPIHGKPRTRVKALFTVLNYRPNPSEDTNSYRRQLAMDLVLTGNCFQYWDGRDLYQLPSSLIEVHSDKKNKVAYYEYDGKTKFMPNEIIHTRDNDSKSIYTGTSRLRSTKHSIDILQEMLNFQEKFFSNGAVPGLIIQTPNILGQRIKRKLLEDWVRIYKPNSGGKRPMILDGDLKVNPLSQVKFSELDFAESVNSHEKKILKALGVPPILLDSGNNANLRPNIQLFYETTVLPLVAKIFSSYERFFAYDVEPEVVKVRALRPELKEAGQYFTGLVNGGIMTINEAREELRLEKSSEPHADELRIPQNIAGSAENPSEGGRPPADDEDTDD